MLKLKKINKLLNFFKHYLFALLLVSILVACNKKNAGNQKVFVLATTGIIADSLKAISPESLEIKSLMGPGVDPHLYRASHGDIDKLEQASIIFYNGLHLEGKLAEILSKYSKKKKCVALAENLDKKLLRYVDQENKVADPHIWFNPLIWIEVVKVGSENLQSAFPTLKSEIIAKTDKYISELLDLDKQIKQMLEAIPKEKRVLITAHDAFAYFGQHYEVEVHGLQGISTASEFGLYDVKKLLDLITSRKIPAVFVENSVSPKFVQALVDGANAQNFPLKLGGELYSDALGGHNSGADTYIKMLLKNANTLVKGLN